MKPSYKLPAVLALVLVVAAASGCKRDESQGELPQAGSTEQSTQSGQTTMPNQGTDQQTTSSASAADDAALTAKVKAALLTAPELKSMQIDVDTANGVVTLSGEIDSAQNVERATQAAQSVEGVKSVSNQLKVKPQG